MNRPLPAGLSKEELEARLFPQQEPASRRHIPVPEWVSIHRERKWKKVMLSLLWLEYRQEHPEGVATAAAATAPAPRLLVGKQSPKKNGKGMG